MWVDFFKHLRVRKIKDLHFGQEVQICTVVVFSICFKIRAMRPLKAVRLATTPFLFFQTQFWSQSNSYLNTYEHKLH